MKKMAALLIAGGALLGLPSRGISRPAEDPVPRKVQVDVIVTKDGQPVKDLSKADFALMEDDQPVPIESVSLVEAGAGETRNAHRRLVVIYHDTTTWDLNLKPQMAEITDELAKMAAQGIPIMVVRMNWTEDLTVLQDFTDREDLIRAATDSATRIFGGDQIHDNLWMVKSEALDSSQGSRLIRDAEKGARAAYRTVGRQRFETAVGGLLTVCNMIQGLPGKSSILLISDGIPDLSSSSSSVVLAGDRTDREMLDAIHVRDQEGYASVRIFDPFGIIKDKTFDSAEDVLHELIRIANTKGISIYALDPGVFTRASRTGMSEYHQNADATGRTFVEEEKSNQIQNLRLLAEGTNAALFRGSDKLDRMREVLAADFDATYRLSFVPQRAKADGAYHDVSVKLSRKDLDVRARKGYRDETPEDRRLNRLISAYYAPSLYTQIPFAGEFLVISSGKGKGQPWMSIALPTAAVFPADVAAGPMTFDLHVWMKKSGEKAFGGTLSLPFAVDEAFLENVRKRAFLWYFFCGPELDFAPGDYQAVYALVARETDKIGTWRSRFTVPDPGAEPAFLNCVLGAVAENPEKRKNVFALNRETGHLEYGGITFLPQVTNRFSGRQEDVFVFCQIYDPSGAGKAKPEFRVSDSAGAATALDGEVVAESWNKKSKVWSGLCRIDFRFVPSAERVFQAVVAGPDGKTALSPEIKFVKLNR